ncbi:MAG TPA: hypothetical protein PLY68_07155 [Myxococcota bacterium]|nr:hypothetical protein [Myxococcota bacterium]HQP95959.1 hypothetical protein [Myxococcota bacterium]
MFFDNTGALLIISKHWPDAPITRLTGNGWKRVTLSPDLPDDAVTALPDIEIRGIGWTDETGATRVYLPSTGLGGWLYDLDDGVITGATRVPATFEGAFVVRRRSRDSLGAWLADADSGCLRPCAMTCGAPACAWQCETDVCLGTAMSTGGWTSDGIPVTATSVRDATTGQAGVELAWPDGSVTVPIDVSSGEKLQTRLTPRAGGGLLLAAYARLEPTIALVAFDTAFDWKKYLFEAADADDAVYGFAVAGTMSNGADLGHLVFATSFDVTFWTVDLLTGSRTKQGLTL